MKLYIYSSGGTQLVCMEGPLEGPLAGCCKAGGIMKSFGLYDASGLLVEGFVEEIHPNWKGYYLDTTTKCTFESKDIPRLMAMITQETPTPAPQDTTCPECYGTGFYKGIGAPCDCVGGTAVATVGLVEKFEDLKVGMRVRIKWDKARVEGTISKLREGDHIYLEGSDAYYTVPWEGVTVEILP